MSDSTAVRWVLLLLGLHVVLQLTGLAHVVRQLVHVVLEKIQGCQIRHLRSSGFAGVRCDLVTRSVWVAGGACVGAGAAAAVFGTDHPS